MQTIVTSLLNGGLDHTDLTVYTTGTCSPGADTHIRAYWSSAGSPDGLDVTVTGLGLTWTKKQFVLDGGRAIGFSTAVTGGSAPTPGALTLTCSAAAIGLGWCILGDVGVDLTDPIVQTVLAGGPADTSSVTTAAATLAAAGNSANRAGFWNAHRGNTAVTPRTNWTELFDQGSTGPVMDYEYQQRTDAFEADCSATWTTAVRYQAIAVELKAGADVGAEEPYWGILL